MFITFLGFVGFCLLIIYDLFSIRHIGGRSVLAILGYVAHTSAIAAAAAQDRTLLFAPWAVFTGWLLSVVGMAWLLYTLFLYPPLLKTYFQAQGPVLTTEGPYALTRHPGILGYGILIAGLIIGSRSLFLLRVAPFWFLANLVYIIAQDLWMFPALFPGYQGYRRTTPMLFPTCQSFRRFWASKIVV